MSKTCPVTKSECKNDRCTDYGYCGLQGSSSCRFCGMYMSNVKPYICGSCWQDIIAVVKEFPELIVDSGEGVE